MLATRQILLLLLLYLGAYTFATPCEGQGASGNNLLSRLPTSGESFLFIAYSSNLSAEVILDGETLCEVKRKQYIWKVAKPGEQILRARWEAGLEELLLLDLLPGEVFYFKLSPLGFEPVSQKDWQNLVMGYKIACYLK